MTYLMESQIFFIISSVGFIVLGALITVILILIIRLIKSFNELISRIEKDIDTIGDTTVGLIEDIRDSTFFRFFGSRRIRKNETVIKDDQ
jgi:hypothetical protein